MHREMQLRAERFEQRHISATLVAEDKIASHANALNLPQVEGQSTDESLAALFAEPPVEINQQQRIRAQRFDDTQFLRQRIDQRRNFGGRNDRAGMTIESHDQCHGVILPGIRYGLADDLLVAKMHAIEKSDGDANFALRRF